MQRFFDIIFSLLALVLLSPLLLPICLVLAVTGEREIFYFQERIGRGGKKFKIFKFATMLKDSPFIGTGTVTVRDDPRVLPTGKFLRKTKINELPQLLNIVNGDMSLIGPRPVTPRGFAAYGQQTQAIISRMRPGLSGIGSVVFRDEENLLSANADPERFYDEVIAPYKGALEEWYFQNQGVFTYFKLTFLTVFVVFSSSLNLVWRVFPDAPPPPKALAKIVSSS